jgi:hypothetical protein
MQNPSVPCPSCSASSVIKKGKNARGVQMFHCQSPHCPQPNFPASHYAAAAQTAQDRAAYMRDYRQRKRDDQRASRLAAIPTRRIGNCTLYQGDASTILPLLTGLDVLITDPPYGVLSSPTGGSHGTGGKHGLVRDNYATYDDTYANFYSTVVPILRASLARVVRAAVFTGPHIQEQPKAPVTGGVYMPSGSGRHVWGFKTLSPILFYGHAPNLHHGARGKTTLESAAVAEQNGHPCPKPLAWMRWLVALCSLPGETVFDPFMGSGTTGEACVEYGRPFVGIEIDAGYFATACARIEAATRQGRLFDASAPPAHQEPLFA